MIKVEVVLAYQTLCRIKESIEISSVRRKTLRCGKERAIRLQQATYFDHSVNIGQDIRVLVHQQMTGNSGY